LDIQLYMYIIGYIHHFVYSSFSRTFTCSPFPPTPEAYSALPPTYVGYCYLYTICLCIGCYEMLFNLTMRFVNSVQHDGTKCKPFTSVDDCVILLQLLQASLQNTATIYWALSSVKCGAHDRRHCRRTLVHMKLHPVINITNPVCLIEVRHVQFVKNMDLVSFGHSFDLFICHKGVLLCCCHLFRPSNSLVAMSNFHLTVKSFWRVVGWRKSD